MELIDKVLEKAEILNEFTDVERIWVDKSGINAVIFIEMEDGETKCINIDIASVLPPELTDPTTYFYKDNFENIAIYVLVAHISKLINNYDESKITTLDAIYRLVVNMIHFGLRNRLSAERFLIKLINAIFVNTLDKKFSKIFSETTIIGVESDYCDYISDRLEKFKKCDDELKETIYLLEIETKREIGDIVRIECSNYIKLLDTFMYLKMVYMNRMRLINFSYNICGGMM